MYNAQAMAYAVCYAVWREYYVAEHTITGSGIMEDMSFHGPDLDR